MRSIVKFPSYFHIFEIIHMTREWGWVYGRTTLLPLILTIRRSSRRPPPPSPRIQPSSHQPLAVTCPIHLQRFTDISAQTADKHTRPVKIEDIPRRKKGCRRLAPAVRLNTLRGGWVHPSPKKFLGLGLRPDEKPSAFSLVKKPTLFGR